MEEKPKINIKQYQTTRIKYSYLIKFALYIVVLLGLLFWFNHQQSKKEQKPVPKELNFKKIKIEP